MRMFSQQKVLFLSVLSMLMLEALGLSCDYEIRDVIAEQGVNLSYYFSEFSAFFGLEVDGLFIFYFLH